MAANQPQTENIDKKMEEIQRRNEARQKRFQEVRDDEKAAIAQGIKPPKAKIEFSFAEETNIKFGDDDRKFAIPGRGRGHGPRWPRDGGDYRRRPDDARHRLNEAQEGREGPRRGYEEWPAVSVEEEHFKTMEFTNSRSGRRQDNNAPRQDSARGGRGGSGRGRGKRRFLDQSHGSDRRPDRTEKPWNDFPRGGEDPRPPRPRSEREEPRQERGGDERPRDNGQRPQLAQRAAEPQQAQQGQQPQQRTSVVINQSNTRQTKPARKAESGANKPSSQSPPASAGYDESAAAHGLPRQIQLQGPEIIVKIANARASERFERPERGDRPERAERPERGEWFERGERPERGDRSERPERSYAPERGDRPERPDRLDRGDRPERYDRFAKGDQRRRDETRQAPTWFEAPPGAQQPERDNYNGRTGPWSSRGRRAGRPPRFRQPPPAGPHGHHGGQGHTGGPPAYAGRKKQGEDDYEYWVDTSHNQLVGSPGREVPPSKRANQSADQRWVKSGNADGVQSGEGQQSENDAPDPPTTPDFFKHPMKIGNWAEEVERAYSEEQEGDKAVAELTASVDHIRIKSRKDS